MKVELKMPKLRANTDTAVLCAWCKESGETFESGEVLCEVETDKVVHQVEAEQSGVMGRQFAEEGDEVAVGTVIAEVEA